MYFVTMELHHQTKSLKKNKAHEEIEMNNNKKKEERLISLMFSL